MMLDPTPRLPLLALSMGDPAGVGPELLVKAYSQGQLTPLARIVAVGSVAILQRACDLARMRLNIHPIRSIEEARFEPDVLDCLEPKTLQALDLLAIPLGHPHPLAGIAAHACVDHAIDLALARLVDALVTLPLCKESLAAGGIKYPGHTEILAERCAVPKHAMMLWLPPERGGGPAGLGVAHATLHVPLRAVPHLITRDRVYQAIQLAEEGMRALGLESPPRIAVAALNPHAGEAGLFGNEEPHQITPAVERARDQKINAVGPIAADTLFPRALSGEFDAVVAMYHDQGHVAIKSVGFDQAVNITLGLPIIRTSVAHGTAFDLVGTGQARTDSLIQSVRAAVRLAQTRNRSKSHDFAQPC
jgi:4-hydroxythreonine-4-phosphate dehydrogenase